MHSQPHPLHGGQAVHAVVAVFKRHHADVTPATQQEQQRAGKLLRLKAWVGSLTASPINHAGSELQLSHLGQQSQAKVPPWRAKVKCYVWALGFNEARRLTAPTMCLLAPEGAITFHHTSEPTCTTQLSLWEEVTRGFHKALQIQVCHGALGAAGHHHQLQKQSSWHCCLHAMTATTMRCSWGIAAPCNDCHHHEVFLGYCCPLQ